MPAGALSPLARDMAGEARTLAFARRTISAIMGKISTSDLSSTVEPFVKRRLTRLQHFVQSSLPRSRVEAQRIGLAVAPSALAVLTGILGPILLLWLGVLAPVDDGLANVGFDAERVLLIERVLCALLGGFIGAGLSGRRFGAAVGSLMVYGLFYLLPFAQQAAHPGFSPTGDRQVVIPSAYVGVLITLTCLGIIAAAIGAVLGGAVAELIVAPAQALASSSLRSMRRDGPRSTRAMYMRPALTLGTGIVLTVVTIAGVNGVAAVLTDGPTTGIYAPVGSIALPGLSPGGTRGAPNRGTLQQGQYVSPALGGITRQYIIYLPPSYSTDSTTRYPTIYLLHGSPGGPSNWMTDGQAPLSEDSLVAAHRMREAILVAADGRGPIYRTSEWANSFDGRQRMEDAIVTDLVGFIDKHYRTLPDAADRVIAGLSEGGFGAVNIALHHPDVFGVAVSAGGYFTADAPLFGGGGLVGNFYRAYNSPLLYISSRDGQRALRQLRFVIGAGKGDGHIYTGAVTFVQQLRAAHADVTVIELPGGHSWANWAVILARAFQIVEPPDGVKPKAR
jgi:enterochelin esterase-like enzyme